MIFLLKNLIRLQQKTLCKTSTSKFSWKNDIDGFVREVDFDDKLKNLNKNVTSNKK